MSPYVGDGDERPSGFSDYRGMTISHRIKFLEGYYVVDWDGRLIYVGEYPALIPWKDFLNLTGPIERARGIRSPGLMHRWLNIGSISLAPEITLDDPDTLRQNWFYILPEECRVRADRAYQSLRSSMPAEIDRQIYKYVDVLSLGSIMNGVVI